MIPVVLHLFVLFILGYLKCHNNSISFVDSYTNFSSDVYTPFSLTFILEVFLIFYGLFPLYKSYYSCMHKFFMDQCLFGIYDSPNFYNFYLIFTVFNPILYFFFHLVLSYPNRHRSRCSSFEFSRTYIDCLIISWHKFLCP